MILLQSTPNEVDHRLNEILMEVCSLPYVDRCQNFHIWQTTYGEYVGSLRVVLKQSGIPSDYRTVFEAVELPWKSLFTHCTVQVVTQDEAQD